MKLDVGKVKNIKGGQTDFSLQESLDSGAFDYGELVFAEPVVVCGTVSNLGGILSVTGTVRGRLELLCNRCLQPFLQDFAVSLSEQFSNKPELITEDGESAIHLFEGSEIDITLPVLKEIYLSLPMQVICAETCRGLCPGCGANLNLEPCRCTDRELDPRLEKLLQFNNQGKGV